MVDSYALPRKVVLSSVLGFGLLGTTGCPNLGEIAALPKMADGAKTTLPLLARPLKGSCDRQNFYSNPTDNPAATPSCSLGDAYGPLGENMIIEQGVLLAYFEALGKLAGGTTSGFSKSVSGIDGNLKIAGLDSDQRELAGSAGKLAAAISAMIADDYKRRKLSEVRKAFSCVCAVLVRDT